MALIVHRAAQAADLVEGLADLLATPARDPFAQELVVIPARGVERWLSQRLSHRLGAVADDGVCAGVDFVAAAEFGRRVGDADGGPWSVGELTWTVLSVIDASLDEDWCFTLATHLGHYDEGETADFKQGRRFATAQRLARLFVSYVAQRPEMLLDWEGHRDTDGFGEPLPLDLVWQPELWRRVVAAVGQVGPVQARQALLTAVTQGRPIDLPQRLSFFGNTRMSTAQLALLHAVAEVRDVHLWLPHPSPDLWRQMADHQTWAGLRSADTSYVAAVHPLLAAWGRDSRELQQRLGPVTEVEEPRSAAPEVEEPQSGVTKPGSLLATLQADIAANRLPTQRPSTDASISIHSCHGPSRQVEVLRELLVGMLQDDPTLQPRDIVVMCPDIEAYAPLIEAAFGLTDVIEDGHPGHRLRVRLADRSLVQTNPLMAVVGTLLNLAAGRAEASRILDFLALAPVSRRFRFTDDDLAKIGTWVEETGIRWAFDATSRREYGLEDYPQNTWASGLDRLLTGVALSDDSNMWLGRTLPLDDVGSSDIDLVGRLTEAVARLADITAALRGQHPLAHWLAVMNDAIESLAVSERGEEWQLAQVRRELAEVLSGADESGHLAVELGLSDVRAMVADRVAGRPTRANFRTGSLTVCTMTPMRSVPHRVVCLLGLDDGVFPRGLRADGDDLLARVPAVGDRDPRSEDRQLLLDAVLAAQERLIVTYSGRHEVTGEPRPPAVVLGELCDVLNAMAPGEVVHEEPLQAFNPALVDARNPRSFDQSMTAAARAAVGVREPERHLGEVAYVPQLHGDVELDDLVSFLLDPAKVFLRRRLEVNIDADEDERGDEMPIDLDGLAEWQIGDRMLRELYEGSTTEQVLAREWRRGVLPPGKLGWARAQQIVENSLGIATTAQAITQGAQATSRDITVDLGGRLLSGTVTDLFDSRVVKMTYSRLGPKSQVQAWVSLLALAADAPGRGWSAGALGRGSRGAVDRVAFRAPENPLEILRDLVALYDAGLDGPLPLPLKSSFAWVEGYRQGTGGRAYAYGRTRWEDDRFPGERSQPSQLALWGPMSWDELLAIKPREDEDPLEIGSRLGALAVKAWGRLMEHGHRAGGGR